jgi:hypothetical protein
VCFWRVNEVTELVSGMPAPQFGDESSWVRGSDVVQGSSGSCVSFWCKMFSRNPGRRPLAYTCEWGLSDSTTVTGPWCDRPVHNEWRDVTLVVLIQSSNCNGMPLRAVVISSWHCIRKLKMISIRNVTEQFGTTADSSGFYSGGAQFEFGAGHNASCLSLSWFSLVLRANAGSKVQ